VNVLSLCSGIGALELGLERAGMTTVGQVERDPFCQRVLAKHWPEVPKHDDVLTAVDWWQSQPRPGVDLVAAGFPCQPVSHAGKRAGEDDERWLWPDVDRLIGALRPEWVLFENVPGLRTLGLGTVLADLDRRGYRVRVGTVSACAVGAPHTRERLFGVAHAPGFRQQRRWSPRPAPQGLEHEGRRQEPRRSWSAESRPHGVAYGVPARVDRLKAIGNAVVPQVAEHIGRLIVAAEAAERAA
jgi:DNA (cytosine-5)-methyltransferase 1